MTAIRGWGVKGPDGELELQRGPIWSKERYADIVAAELNACDGIEAGQEPRYRAVRVVLREEE